MWHAEDPSLLYCRKQRALIYIFNPIAFYKIVKNSREGSHRIMLHIWTLFIVRAHKNI